MSQGVGHRRKLKEHKIPAVSLKNLGKLYGAHRISTDAVAYLQLFTDNLIYMLLREAFAMADSRRNRGEAARGVNKRIRSSDIKYALERYNMYTQPLGAR